MDWPFKKWNNFYCQSTCSQWSVENKNRHHFTLAKGYKSKKTFFYFNLILISECSIGLRKFEIKPKPSQVLGIEFFLKSLLMVFFFKVHCIFQNLFFSVFYLSTFNVFFFTCATTLFSINIGLNNGGDLAEGWNPLVNENHSITSFFLSLLDKLSWE